MEHTADPTRSVPDVLSEEQLRAATGPLKHLTEIRVFATLDSTSSYLRREMSAAPSGLVVIAEHQSAGRGREGRTWVSPPGAGIYCSVLLSPPMRPSEAWLLTAAAAVAVRDAVTTHADLPAWIKWPNDVLLAGRKVAGILAESRLHRDGSMRVILGMGVNVHASPSDPEIAATHIAASSSRPVTRVSVLAVTLRRLDELLDMLYSGQREPVRSQWRERLSTVGQLVEVRTPQGKVRGLAVGVQDDGGLVVRTAEGPTVVYAGDAIEAPS